MDLPGARVDREHVKKLLSRPLGIVRLQVGSGQNQLQFGIACVLRPCGFQIGRCVTRLFDAI